MLRQLVFFLLAFSVPALAGPDEARQPALPAHQDHVDALANQLLAATDPEAPAAPAEAGLWKATRATESPRSRALRRFSAYAGATTIALLLGALFYMYGAWYKRKLDSLTRIEERPLLNGPGHGDGLPPTPAA